MQVIIYSGLFVVVFILANACRRVAEKKLGIQSVVYIFFDFITAVCFILTGIFFITCILFIGLLAIVPALILTFL